MNNINPVRILDGNKYLIAGNNNVNVVSDFDSVYNQATGVSYSNITLEEIFETVSEEYDVNINLLKAVAKVESNFDTNSVSSSGAMGIMQLMPFTAETYGVEDPFNPLQNITGSAKMLSGLLKDYNGNVTLALAAYNAGSGAVGRSGGVPDTAQVQRYVQKVNDVLGGALSDDSRTIEGAEPTVMDFPDVEVPDTVYACLPVDQIQILEVIRYEGSEKEAIEKKLNAGSLALSLYEAATVTNKII